MITNKLIHKEQPMKPIILKEYYANKDAIIYGRHIIIFGEYCGDFWDMSDDEETKEILEQYDISDEKWQQVLDAIKLGRGDTDHSNLLPVFAIEYCKEVGVDEKMRQIILDSKDPHWMECYHIDVKKDEEMRQLISTLS